MGVSKSMKRQREVEDSEAVTVPENGAQQQRSEAPSKKARVEHNRSLFVRSLPPSATAETLTEFFSQYYPVKHAVVVLDPKTKKSRGYGFVTFTDEDDALEAKEKLKDELLDGRRLKLDIAEPRHRDAISGSKASEEKRKREEAVTKERRPPKLIIRNLPWSIKTPEQLSALFRSFGKVKFADLPNNKGKLAGFGFVTIRGRKNAERAIEAVNGKVVDGRTLAVDWAVDKETWERQKRAPTEEGDSESPDKKPKKDSADKKPKSQEDEDLANFMKNHLENLEEESVSSDGEEGKDEDDEDQDSEEDAEDDASEVESADESEEEKPKRTTDNSTTIFIRNLPFTTTDEQLKAHFSKFGPIRYARIVKERATDRPAGTGFVCFAKHDDFKACLRHAPRQRPPPTLGKPSILQDERVDQDGRYTLEGRVLQVAQAVGKEEATRLAAEGPGAKRLHEKDKRRLFLLSEGTIPRSSPLYQLLTPAEIKLREDSEKQRKKLIQSNPALHLSLTRLAVRNIPRELGSKDLKALARQAVVGFAKDVKEGHRQPLSKEELSRGGPEDKEAERRRKEKGKGVVRQAKIVFETKEGSKVPEESGAGRSRGYGFIEYSSHRWALMGLRWLNGHPLKTQAGKTLRLVVEFAIENANVVQRRKAFEERTRQQGKTGAASNSSPGPDTKGTRSGGKSGDKGKGGKGNKREKGKGKYKGKKGEDDMTTTAIDKDSKAGRKADAKLALKTKIIARKRMLRKKKAASRRGK